MNDNPSGRIARITLRDKFLKLTLFCLFLLYPGVSSKILGMFVCQKVNGISYLVSDFSIVCYDSQWMKYLIPAIFLILIYPIGIPCMFLFLLIKYRHRKDMILSLGFLYEAYNKDVWWFELVDMFFKLFLTSLLPFFATIQIQVGIVVAIVYMGTILLARPYVRQIDDRLHIVSILEIFIFLLTGLVLNNEPFVTGSAIDIILSILMLGITVLIVIGLLINAFILFKKIVNRKRRKITRSDTKLNDNLINSSVISQVSTDSTNFNNIQLQNHDLIEMGTNPLTNLNNEFANTKSFQVPINSS